MNRVCVEHANNNLYDGIGAFVEFGTDVFGSHGLVGSELKGECLQGIEVFAQVPASEDIDFFEGSKIVWNVFFM